MTGYVTTTYDADIANRPDEGELETGLRIPNREISGIFQRTVVDHFKKTLDRTELQKLMTALWNGNEKSESEARMEYWCDHALEQIEEKGYARDLHGYKQILRYGIAFYQKSALVKKGK